MSEVSPAPLTRRTYSSPPSLVIRPAEGPSATAVPPAMPRDSAHFVREAIFFLLELASRKVVERAM